MNESPKRRRPFKRLAAFAVLAAAVLIATALLRHPQSPLPPQWNVFEPLDIDAPVTPLTQWKLDWAAQEDALCLSVLAEAGQIETLPDLTASETCGIAPRVRVSALGTARLDPVETTCATALRTAMWERHGIQPAARALLGAEVSVIRHIGSYNCRSIRGSTTRWSTHATAQAIDISGFDLVDGRRLRLLSDWSSDGAEGIFLRQVRDAACIWFKTTLGPEYNALHADHFHLQARGWGTCR
ncbi:extensin family protein [Primorskyibacter sp. S187A]|uniref:extensin-like domain-containing protein n=1 Tax=Primorskyibacter sp. S187A TaxID=3415130 RepID=UPI003C79DA7A